MLKIKNITKKQGFTKEQQTYIADTVLDILNQNKNIELITKYLKDIFKNNLKEALSDKKLRLVNAYYDGLTNGDTIKIAVPGTKCKYELYNDIKCLYNFLNKIGVLLVADTVQNKIYEKLKATKQAIHEAPEFITNGDILLTKEFLGAIPEEERQQIKNKMADFIPTNLIKLDDYRKEQKQVLKIRGKNHTFCIFYKNKKDDFVVFNQIYIDMFKGCDFYFDDDTVRGRKYSKLVAKKDNKVVGFIMPCIFENLYCFELLPDIMEQESEIKEAQIIEPEPEQTTEATEATEDKKEDKKPDIKNIINKIYNKVETTFAKTSDNYKAKYKHKNYLTEHEYSGHNTKILDCAMSTYGFTSPLWIGSGQAHKIQKQVKSNAHGITIQVYYADDDGRTFSKMEKIYNIDELEAIQSIENSDNYKDMVKRLKRA